MKDLYMTGGKHAISQVLVTGDLKESIRKAVDAIGGLGKTVSEGDTVLIKPNFNSNDLFPASSDPAFVRAVVELCMEAGAGRVKVIDSAGFPWLPTTKVFNSVGMTKVARESGIELVPLDYTDVMEIQLDKTKDVTTAMMYSEAFDEEAKLIWLPCMKTDSYARFSMSLKLVEGLLDVRKKQWFNSEPANLENMIAELNTTIAPHLIIMDARKAFSSGGPVRGRVVKPNTILASGDRITMDVTALKILMGYPDDNLLDRKPWDYIQIKRAAELGLGAKSDKDIELV
jgi:uncharacterized protein (DUF362 family)